MTLHYRLHEFENRLRKFALLVMLFPITLVLVPGSVPAKTESETSGQAKITLTSALVMLPVNVTDAKGTFVAGLKAQNFRVFEDGVPQDITVFKEEDAPVTVGLVVDHSFSMALKLSGVILAVSAFAHSSNSEDEMFVVDFNENVMVEMMGGKAFSHNAAELQKAVSAVSARGQTALYDAVVEGLVHIELGKWDKKALIVVSDGGDNASQAKFPELLAMAQRDHVMIYCIGLVDEAGEEENPKVLRKLSQATGGITFLTKQSEEAAKFTKEIARDLREQYALGYAPSAKNGGNTFRKTTVEVSSPDRGKLRVRTRPGYFPHEAKKQEALAGGEPR